MIFLPISAIQMPIVNPLIPTILEVYKTQQTIFFKVLRKKAELTVSES